VSRLDFAPKLEEVKILDIKKGLGSFVPKPEKAASFAALKATLKKAGYTLNSAEITVVGTLVQEDASWWIEVDSSKQRFFLEGKDLNQALGDATPGARLEVIGDWQTVGSGGAAREVITLRSAKQITAANN